MVIIFKKFKSLIEGIFCFNFPEFSCDGQLTVHGKMLSITPYMDDGPWGHLTVNILCI